MVLSSYLNSSLPEVISSYNHCLHRPRESERSISKEIDILHISSVAIRTEEWNSTSPYFLQMLEKATKR
jgi:hypothetical protein